VGEAAKSSHLSMRIEAHLAALITLYSISGKLIGSVSFIKSQDCLQG
jgi:hypothetical protein